MRAFGAVLALALTGAMVVIPSAADTPRAAADCVQSGRSANEHDPDNPPESEVVTEQSDEEKILQTLLDKHQLPAGMLVKGQDGKVHAKLSKGQVKIPVYVHVVHNGPEGKVTDAEINKQMSVLNNNYAANTAFTFQLMGTDRTNNRDWFRAVVQSPTEKAMKTKLHKGKANDLNLYLNEPQAPDGDELLGIATWPKDSQRSAVLDGTMVKYNTLPGSGAKPYDEGKTATHEVGHWLGLYHTFQGGCADPGDEVADTPAEDGPAFGCPTGRDSCPAPGLDPIHNFMDYGDDACLTRFTPGQAQRAADHWAAYRQPRIA